MTHNLRTSSRKYSSTSNSWPGTAQHTNKHINNLSTKSFYWFCRDMKCLTDVSGLKMSQSMIVAAVWWAAGTTYQWWQDIHRSTCRTVGHWEQRSSRSPSESWGEEEALEGQSVGSHWTCLAHESHPTRTYTPCHNKKTTPNYFCHNFRLISTNCDNLSTHTQLHT